VNIICYLQYSFIYGYLSELLSHFQCKSRKLDRYMKMLSSSFYCIFLSNFAHEADSFAPSSLIILYIINKYITYTRYGFNLALMCNFAQQPSQTTRFALHKNRAVYTTKACGKCGLSDPRPLLGRNRIHMFPVPSLNTKLQNNMTVNEA